MSSKTDVEVVLRARTPDIAQMVQDCADGKLPFAGPDSLCSWLASNGYSTTSAYEMVRATARTEEPQP
jgi:hypothetical protein